MNEITVRAALPSDIPSLCKLEQECFSLPWSEASFKAFFESDSRAFVAEYSGIAVGYVGMYLSFGDGDITNVAVTESHRRRGIGRLLIGALTEVPTVERLLLEVRESNLGARALYEKLGFKVDGIRKNFYEKPRENAILMSLELNKDI